jgi:Ubiquitin family
VAPVERRFEVSVQSTFTIKELKQALYDYIQTLEEGRERPKDITADNQRIIYCGKELADSKVCLHNIITHHSISVRDISRAGDVCCMHSSAA